MSRRSSRLVSGGYYNSDEESDSSSVTNISYRENPVKYVTVCAHVSKDWSLVCNCYLLTVILSNLCPVSDPSFCVCVSIFFRVFKKKAGNRKAGSRTSSRTNSNASLPSPESPLAAGQSEGKKNTTSYLLKSNDDIISCLYKTITNRRS